MQDQITEIGIGIGSVALAVLLFYGLFKLHKRNRKIRKKLADQWKKDLDQKLYKHRFHLISEEKRHTTYDAYGNKFSQWLKLGDTSLDPDSVQSSLYSGSRVFSEGLGYFWRNVILDSPDNARVFFQGWEAYLAEYKPTNSSGDRYKSKSDWFTYLAIEELKVRNQAENSSSVDVDSMSGLEYERHCRELMEAGGMEVTETPATADQGVDLIGTYGTGDFRLCIQCKRYSSPVGNKAVQEVAAGLIHYSGSLAAVVSTAGFTKAARQLAESTDVLLLSTDQFAEFVKHNRSGWEALVI